MKKVAIIQVRTASTRLPRKCMLQISGMTILEHIVKRLEHSEELDDICIATTEQPEDDHIEMLSRKLGTHLYRGSPDDVLDRFYHAAEKCHATVICRVTADDPFKDPSLVDQFIRRFQEEDCDYLSNTIEPTYPEGIDIEIFSMDALREAWQNAKLESEREHVTPYIWKQPNNFKIISEKYKKDLSSYRWTLDKPADFVFIQQIYDRLYQPDKLFLMKDILAVLEREPWLKEINAGTVRNEGYLKSIKNETQNS